MSGEYIIGTSAAADFASFREAVDSLQAQGVQGAVVFNVEDGTYNEQVAINPVAGVSSVNNIVFQSQSRDSSKVTLSFTPLSSQNNYTLFLAGADHISFRRMSIVSTGAAFSRVIFIHYGADSNAFISNIIKGAAYPVINYANSQDVSLIYSPWGYAYNNVGNVFKNNSFINGYHAFEYYGSSTLNPAKGTLIENNIFMDQTSAAIYMTNQHDPQIKGNLIQNNQKSSFYGILLSHCHAGFEVSKNRFFASECVKGTAIQIEACKGNTDKKALIANNFIVINSRDTLGSFNDPTVAVKISSSDSVKFLYNSLSLIGDYAKGIGLYVFANKALYAVNNILLNKAGGYAVKFADSSLKEYYFNHNNYLSSDEKIINFRDSSYCLQNWQSLGIVDSASLSVCPDFQGKTDLHSFSLLLNNRGLPLSFVSDDIDGEQRDQWHPDIGADEFTPLSFDAALFELLHPLPQSNCKLGENEKIAVSIINKGVATISNIPMKLSITNYTDVFATITDSLISSDTLIFVFADSFDLSSSDFYEINVSVEDSRDENEANNRLRARVQNLKTIDRFPFTETFEKGYSDVFSLFSQSSAYIAVDSRAAYQGSYGLHFQGKTPGFHWEGSYKHTTAAQAWEQNISSHALAKSCLIDATDLSQIRMSLMLLQTYSYGHKLSWFRVMVNDSIPIADMDGLTNFNPQSNIDGFELKCFDLAAFAGTKFSLSLQSACFTFDKYYQDGDNVLVDSIVFFEPPAFDLGVADIPEPGNPLCGEALSPVILQLKNYGYAPQSNFATELQVRTPYGNFSFTDTFRRVLAPNKSDTFTIAYINTAPTGEYFLKAYTSDVRDSFCNRNDTFTNRFEIIPLLSMPQINIFSASDSLDNWDTENMWVAYKGHHGTPSYLLSNSIWIEDSAGSAFYNKKIEGISKNTWLLFEYRIVNSNYPFGGRQLTGGDFVQILLSPDCGRTYDTLYTIQKSNHSPSDKMRQMQFSLADYEGKDIIFGFVIISDSFNITYFDFDSIIVADLPELPALNDTALCDGSILVLITPNDSLVSYKWFKNSITNLFATTPSVSITDSGIYYLIASDQNGWTNIDSFKVSLYPLPSIQGVGDTVVCKYEELILQPAGADVFIWNNSDTTLTFRKTAVETFKLYLTAVNHFGCEFHDSFVISVNPLPLVNVDGNKTVCFGEPVNLVASGGKIYYWDGNLHDSVYSFIPDKSRYLHLLVKGDDDCSFGDSIFIRVDSLPEIEIEGDSIVCYGDLVVLHAKGAESYKWSTGDTTAWLVFPAISDSKLIIEGSSLEQCSAMRDINIRVKPLPQPYLGNDTLLCAHKSITLNPGNFDAYLWFNGAETANITVDSNGIGLDTLPVWVRVEKDECFGYDTVLIVFDPCTSVETEIKTTSAISVFPNPASDHIFIHYHSSCKKNLHVVITDMQGKVVMDKAIRNNPSQQLSLEGLNEGLYLLRIENANAISVVKLLIIK